MTIIVSHNGILATDKQCTKGSLKYPVVKLLKWRSWHYAYAGEFNVGEQLIRWFKNGQKVNEFPEIDLEGYVTPLVVASAKTGVMSYEGDPNPIKFGWTTHAWGSGAPMALGALKMGATAVEAVEMANENNIYCGLGVDWAQIRKD